MREQAQYESIPELDEVAQSIGQFIEYWGFKEIEGKIWTHIFLSDRALCAQDLMDRLGVSKGLISISVKRLLDFEVIRVDYTRSKRTQYFQINEDVTTVIKQVLRSRERKMMGEIKSRSEMLSTLSPAQSKGINYNRVKFLIKMISVGQKILDAIIFTTEKLPSMVFGKAPKIEKQGNERRDL